MPIKQPKQTTSNHKRSYCAVVFDKDGFIDCVIHSNNPMWGAAIYCKAENKKTKRGLFAEKAVLRQPRVFIGQ